MPAAAGARGPILDAPRPGATGFRLGRHPRIKPDVPCENSESRSMSLGDGVAAVPVADQMVEHLEEAVTYWDRPATMRQPAERRR